MEDPENEVQTLVNEFLTKNPEKERILADGIGVSIPTIKRWRSGTNFPHPAMAKRIVSYLKRQISEPHQD